MEKKVGDEVTTLKDAAFDYRDERYSALRTKIVAKRGSRGTIVKIYDSAYLYNVKRYVVEIKVELNPVTDIYLTEAFNVEDIE